MARHVSDRELGENDLNFAVATHREDEAIRRLLRQNPMRGSVSLTFEREPSCFLDARMAGGDDQTIVAYSGTQLVCVGRCTWRDSWIDGQTKRIGYLGELRLDENAKSRMRMLRGGYETFRGMQQLDPAALYFTSIGSENHRARRLLEAGIRGLPTYEFLANFETLLIVVPHRTQSTRLRLRNPTLEDLPRMARLLNTHAQQRQLATAWDETDLINLKSFGLPLDRMFIATDGSEMIACGGLWDQRAFRQTVIRGYSRPLSISRPFINLAGYFLGTPRLPRSNSILAHAFLSPVAFAPGAEGLLSDFIRGIFPIAAGAGIEFLTIGLSASDQRLPILRRRFSTRKWSSRLYQVSWMDRERYRFRSLVRSFVPDVALL